MPVDVMSVQPAAPRRPRIRPSVTRVFLTLLATAACRPTSTDSTPAPLETDTPRPLDTEVIDDTEIAVTPPVYVVLMTHIEDSTPAAALDGPAARPQYLDARSAMLQMGLTMQQLGLTWVLQPDWKVLEAARLFEDEDVMADTDAQNVFAYLQDTLSVRIDPHSHETQGYNYTDVAHLLTLLEVGGSTVMGGHIWDPELDSFQHWDRYREPEAGGRYPEASWQAEIVIGAGTPNHVNDPLISGVWRPRDRDHFFEHDPAANLVSIGSGVRLYDVDKPDRPAAFVDAVRALVADQAEGKTPPGQLVTAYINLGITYLKPDASLAALRSELLEPMAALQASGDVVVTDFQEMSRVWSSMEGSGVLYEP